eukprot:scaffold14613_cov59-Phaeocystis_antarctica.AAC.11
MCQWRCWSSRPASHRPHAFYELPGGHISQNSEGRAEIEQSICPGKEMSCSIVRVGPCRAGSESRSEFRHL